MCNAWGLSDDDPARLLGDVQDDQVQRTGVLVGIRVALMAILGGRCRRVREWLSPLTRRLLLAAPPRSGCKHGTSHADTQTVI
jgi:hypothetical protein